MTEQDRDLRARLVAAGIELVTEEGVHALGLREIARRAGVSHGAPRRYFPTHRELLAAVARHGFGRLTDTLAGADALAAGTGADPRARIEALARGYLGFAAANPGLFELMFRHDLLEGSGTELRRSTLPLFRTLVGLVGELHPQGGDPTAATAALWSNLHGLAQLRSWGSLALATGSDSDSNSNSNSNSIEPVLRAALTAHLGPADR
ncbi:TetR/AcrR family transcriptional regulator [Kitasatospora sp. NPDC001309]|uniref:TetR/AcrR family transcriptional regulator n=1 Tax=Kitasatospora sp. NPDC001309 TaxID=3364013 RepID=UPI00369B3CC2